MGRVVAVHRGDAMLLGLSATDSSVTVAVPQLERVALWGWGGLGNLVSPRCRSDSSGPP